MSWSQSLALLNASVMAAFGDATAVIGGGSPLQVVFDCAAAMGNVGLSGMATTAPSIVLATPLVPAEVVGVAVVVNAVAYLCVAHEPEGSGMSRLILESA